jgi:peptidoglycan/LPS O-acetylase OafA/YrhL
MSGACEIGVRSTPRTGDRAQLARYDTPVKTERIDSIQILRAAAALVIVLLHAQADAAALGTRIGASFRPSALLPWPAGVDLFFVISGFVMVHASGRLFGSEGAARVFLVRRLARIVPIYWATTTLWLVIALALPGLINSARPDAGAIAAAYLFIPHMRPDGLIQPIYSLGWTLNYEMFFYIAFAVLIGLGRRGVVLALGGLFCAIVLAAWLVPPTSTLLRFWTAPIILLFAAGASVGLLSAEGVRLKAPAALALIAGGIGALAADPPGFTSDALRIDAPATFERLVWWGGPAIAIVAGAALGPWREARGAAGRALVTLGDASYALYLLHPFVIRALREVFLRSGLAGIVGPWGYLAITIMVCCIVSVLAYRWFERPLTRWLQARYS